MRHTVASSDLSAVVYTYDNVTNADPKLNNFNLLNPGRAMAALLKRMKAVNPIMKLLGSVWSPPGWMKLNGVVLGTTVNNNLNPTYSSAYAQYFVDYIRSFASYGVTVDAITIQNEPLNSNAGFPTMYISAEDSTNLIQNFVGPALRNANLPTEIWAYDHNTGNILGLLRTPTYITNQLCRCTILPANRPQRGRRIRQDCCLALLRDQQQLGRTLRLPYPKPQRRSIHDRMLDLALDLVVPKHLFRHGTGTELGRRRPRVDAGLDDGLRPASARWLHYLPRYRRGRRECRHVHQDARLLLHGPVLQVRAAGLDGFGDDGVLRLR